MIIQNGKVIFMVSFIMAVHCVSTTPHMNHVVLVNSSSEDCTDGTSLLHGKPYCQLSDALSKNNGSYTKILVSSNTYMIDTFMNFQFLKNFSLIGECINNCTKIRCANGSGFRFYNSAYIKIQNIQFIECGMAYHSDINQQIAAIIFELCTNVILTAVTFFESRQSGLAIINPSDLVLITGCMFLNSSPLINYDNAYGGGVQLYFSGRSIGDVILQDCHLSNNRAAYGGGLYINMTNNSAENTVLVKKSYFVHNKAKKGGGMFVTFHGSILNNLIVVENAIFDNNACFDKSFQGYGGAVGLELFAALSLARPKNNRILFKKNCTFSNNKACYSGAGISISTARLSQTNNTLHFSEAFFKQNRADYGFAVYAHAPYSQNVGEYFNISISDSNFSQNSLLNAKRTGQGAVYVADVPLKFEGNVVFKHNDGTALVVASTHVTLALNTSTIFSNNKGNLGGAMALLKGATVKFYNNVSVVFADNHAELKGGAIYASDLYRDSLTCPIRHIYDYTNYTVWNVTVYLRNNTVGKNRRSNSVFVPSKHTCMSEHSQQEQQPFCWQNWDYGTNNCSKEVQTSPSWIHFAKEISVFPGQPISLPLYLRLYDDYGNDVTNYSVMTALVSSLSHPLTVGSSYNITIRGKTNDTQNLTIITSEPRVITNSTTIQFAACPPGYYWRQNTCVCGKAKYGGPTVLTCSYPFKASIYWINCMTLYDDETTVVSGICWPNVKVNTTEIKEGFVTLPPQINMLDEQFCQPMNRTGILCSKCVNGFGHAVLSYEVNCVECKSSDLLWNLLKYIAAQYIPLTVFLLLVVILKVSVNNGYANAFVFYSQILANQYLLIRVRHVINHSYSIPYSLLILPYAIWNLDFIQPIPGIPPFCISENLHTLHILTLNYIAAVYPLLLIAISLVLIHLYEKEQKIVTIVWKPIGRCFARFHRKWDIQNTIIDAFGTFIVLSYSKVCIVSFQLLSFTFLQSSDSNISHIKVTWADASIKYGGKEHLPYLITAIVFLATYITLPPLLLLLYPLRVFQRCLDKLCLRGGLTEALFHSFTNCYKDGTAGGRDCRYFASFYFILRIMALLLLCAIPSDFFLLQGALETLLVIIALILILTVKPYRKTVINYLDTFIISCLALVIIVGSYIISWYKLNLKIIFFFFSALPLFYMVGFLIYKAYSKCPCCVLHKKQQASTPCSHRLLCPGEYNRLP